MNKTRRPKLLFLAYPFPPLRVIGCVRTWNIAKHLAKLGWNVTVVTPHPSLWRHVDDTAKVSFELQKEGIQRILTTHRWRFLRPDSLVCRSRGPAWLFGGVCRRMARWLQIETTIGWVKAAEMACASLRPSDVDVILASGSPFLSFRLARRLARKLERPYVLDYRDPWTENPHVSSRPRAKVIREEQELLADCAAAIAVSASWAQALDQRFKAGDKLHVITNGYDAEEMAKVEPHDFGHFAIVYTGNFYPPKRVITPVMAALKSIKEMNQNTGQWYFHYYGKEENHVRAEATKSGVMDRVVLHGHVSRPQALSAVRGADIALAVISNQETVTRDIAGMIPAKLFESLGLGTATLVVGPPGADIDAIIETAGLARRFAGTEIDGIKAFILDAISAQLPPCKNPAVYSWDMIGQKLNVILRQAVSSPVTNSPGNLSSLSHVLAQTQSLIPRFLLSPSNEN